ncbi:DegT/DnrJ/EryC1/StrS family aminotransferase [Nitrospinota bacterium]
MTWKVRFIDYPAQFEKMEGDLMDCIKEVLSRGDLMLRQQLRDFEENLAAFLGARYAVGTSNCTDAMHLSLRAAGVGPDDEVITVSHTFVATAAAIHHAGATPVLVDIGDDHNMDAERIEEAITDRTKAIMPVHLNGRLCDMGRVMEIAEGRGLIVIEDSAQALGGSFREKKGGDWGLAGCFSFYPAKLLGAYGDAGAAVTNDEAMAEKIRRLRDHGRMPGGEMSGWSFNCRMDNLQAAILDLKLKRVPSWIERRREIGAIYHERLSGLPQLFLPPPPSRDSTYFDVFQNFEIEADDRDRLKEYLEENGIETFVQWGGKGVHQFGELGLTHHRLPRTDRMFERSLLLPMHCELADDQVAYVSDCIQRFYK